MKLNFPTLLAPVFAWMLAANAAADTAKTVKVFILAGQSNMEGKGDGAKLTADERVAFMLQHDTYWV